MAAPVRVEHPVRHPRTGQELVGVALITIDRTEVLNALDEPTMLALAAGVEALDADERCRCIVITGAGERAFAAGADVRTLVGLDAEAARSSELFRGWDRVAASATPTLAAVRGFALGGGCELALACDLAVAADDAVFGQPEVGLGIIPGVGGTQRLARAAGKATAMDLVLTGRRMTAAEALACGIVSRVVPAADLVSTALDMAASVAAAAPLAVRSARASVARAFELPLSEGLAREREALAQLFDSCDQEEGMRAFLDKRSPEWEGR
jgi:enoyl-CoA hydratase